MPPLIAAEVIAVGSELLTPTRLDTNSLFITERLNACGIAVRTKTVVGDSHADLAAVLKGALARVDLVVLTGGLGPTDDDVTREAVAAVLGRRLREDPALVERLRARFARRGLDMPEINRRQAMVPEGAEVVANPNGTAPGLWLEDGGKVVVLLPGPPREVRPMVDALVSSRIGPRAGGTVLMTRVLRVAGYTESHAEEAAMPLYARWRDERRPIDATTLAAPGSIDFHLTARAPSAAEGHALLAAAVGELAAAFGDAAYSDDGRSIEEVLGGLLRSAALTVAAAESCTGGLLTSRLTYVPGSLYLAGPFGGAPLSVVAVTPAVAGPFDIGTVVVREALNVNPITARVEASGAASDPIPRILEGIPLQLRDLRLAIDRPEFMRNPTSCAEEQSVAALFGADIPAPVQLVSRFQAASCASLQFKPRLSIKLKGGTRRAAYPALEATVRPRPGDANIKKAIVTLPASAFLAQEHIVTVCTRVQFRADQCPKGSIYGFATARTPLLDEPLRGPVYLRSSNNPLPDLVADLKGLVDVELVGRIDSVKGAIRSNFEAVPDQPVSSFTLKMKGGGKGLITNSENLCSRRSRAVAKMTAQNGRAITLRPVVRAMGCGSKKKR